MTSLVRVLIATTDGCCAIERISLGPFRKSRIFKWDGREPLRGISDAYHEFVRRRIARIPSHDREQTFRFDISGNIDSGESWQLGAFIAHALHSVGRLADKGQDAGTILVATGRIDHELGLAEIGNVEDKLRRILETDDLRLAAERGLRVIFALPEANRADATAEQEQLRGLGAEIVPITRVDELLAQLDLRLSMGPADADDVWEGSPFRGLEVFDKKHRKIFCGRGKAREETLQMLRRQDLAGCSFLLIHGPSGAGKSSLARAGILADIEHASTATDRWRTAVVVPSRARRSPLSSLAEAILAQVPELRLSSDALTRMMLASPEDAAAAIARALGTSDIEGRTRLALLVDQLEELLLWAREKGTKEAAEERDAFSEILARLSRTRSVWVIATLRSDLLTLLEDSPALSDLAKDGRLYRLERPRQGALKEIIRRPAELAGIEFVGHDDDNLPLVDVLAQAAGGQQDCLPLLQFALKLLYDDDKGATRTISYARYQSIGGLEKAIGEWADRTVEGLGADAETRRAVDDVILNLGRRGREADVVVANEIVLDGAFATPARQRVIDALDTARLIVLDAEERTHRRTARVAHEALLTHWPRARALFDAHATALALKDDLERGASRWKDAKKDEAFLIHMARPLAEAEALAADGRVMLSELTGEYIKASRTARAAAIESLMARLARDEQKVLGHLQAADFVAANEESQRIIGYLSEESEARLREWCLKYEAQQRRISRLAEFTKFSKDVYSLIGEEDFAKAPSACEAALRALGMFDDATWWENLPVEDLTREQAQDLKQEIYRTLLMYCALQLVPGIVSLFPGRKAGPPSPRGALNLDSLARFVPNFVLSAVIRRGGLGSFRLPTRQDNPQALGHFDSSLAALGQVRRIEELQAAEKGEPCRRSRASHLAESLAHLLKEFASGPKGAEVNYARWLTPRSQAASLEPVNAVDYFFIGLFNYFIAKRGNDGAFAKIISLMQGSFPDLDGRSPLRTAERLLRSAIALEPRNFWPHWVLGRTLLELREYERAELAFNAAIALQPDYPRGLEQRALALGHQWRRTRDRRLYQRALADSQRAGVLAEGDPSIYWPRGELLELLGETRDALRAYAHWLELEENVSAKIARGAGVSRLYTLATRLLSKAPAEPIHADALALLAFVHWTWKDYASALKSAAAALQIDARHAHALAAMAVTLRDTGEPKQAIREAIDPALAIDPNSPLPLLCKARALSDLGRNQAALDAWQDLLNRSADPEKCAAPRWMIEEARSAVARLTPGQRHHHLASV